MVQAKNDCCYRNAPAYELGLAALDIGQWTRYQMQMIPYAKLDTTGYYLMQLAMRKFDVKKNSFLRKDLIEPVGKPNPLLSGGCL
jgi:hypothetical protein